MHFRRRRMDRVDVLFHRNRNRDNGSAARRPGSRLRARIHAGPFGGSHPADFPDDSVGDSPDHNDKGSTDYGEPQWSEGTPNLVIRVHYPPPV